MELTLDITRVVNSAINYVIVFDTAPMNPTIFFENPFQFNENFSCKLMNFALNYNEQMDSEFMAQSPYFDGILACDFIYKDMLIFGKATFNINKTKGLYLVLKEPGKALYKEVLLKDGGIEYIPSKELLYYEHCCKINKGDYLFNIGGNSAFSNHFVEVYIVADKNAKATITFSEKDYVFRDSHDPTSEQFFSNMQTPYSYVNSESRPDILNQCTNAPGKIFDIKFRRKLFKSEIDGNHTEIAVCDENLLD